VIILNEQKFFNQQSIYTSSNDVPSSVPHRHEFIEIFYVINGTAKHLINNNKLVLKAGDLYIIRPNDQHYFKPIDATPLLHRNFFIKNSEFKRVCDFISPTLFDSLIQQEEIVKTNVNINIINNFEKQIELFSGKNILFAVIIEILDIFLNSSVQTEQSFPLWLQQLLPFLDKPDTFTKSIPEITQDIHLSQSYICTAFKKYIGVSITQYRHTAKLQYAYSLILTSGLSIDAIAEQCGFDSRPYFYKEFKKKYGIVPGYLRKKQKN